MTTDAGLEKEVLGCSSSPKPPANISRSGWHTGWIGIVAVTQFLLLVTGIVFLYPLAASEIDPSVEDIERNQRMVPPELRWATRTVESGDVDSFTQTIKYGRMGFNMTDMSVVQFGCGKVSEYTDILALKAGVYLDYILCQEPDRPNGMEYIQTINIHQAITCPLGSVDAWNREACPYVEPYDYVLTGSSKPQIVTVAQENPGSLWLIGNEVDRRDWPIWDYSVDPPRIVASGGQNEMIAEVYARAYHDLYHLIKGADPTARIANAGVIQATPLRLKYLSIVWDSYQQLYGEPMPVDVWNVHNFILREVRGEYGADFPPGITGTLDDGQYWQQNDRDTHVNLAIFDSQIRALRQWMKERDQQEKPLIVTEYGVLYQHEGMGTAPLVQGFMLDTLDYFLETKDCSLGYAADDCRLVQRWLWFSLEVQTGGVNPYGGLYASDTLTITQTGMKFRSFSEEHGDELTWPPPVKETRYLHLPVIRLE